MNVSWRCHISTTTVVIATIIVTTVIPIVLSATVVCWRSYTTTTRVIISSVVCCWRVISATLIIVTLIANYNKNSLYTRVKKIPLKKVILQNHISTKQVSAVSCCRPEKVPVASVERQRRGRRHGRHVSIPVKTIQDKLKQEYSYEEESVSFYPP